MIKARVRELVVDGGHPRFVELLGEVATLEDYIAGLSRALEAGELERAQHIVELMRVHVSGDEGD